MLYTSSILGNPDIALHLQSQFASAIEGRLTKVFGNPLQQNKSAKHQPARCYKLLTLLANATTPDSHPLALTVPGRNLALEKKNGYLTVNIGAYHAIS